MAVNLSPVGGVAGQFFDNNGDPLVGGKLFTYAAGTTTPQVTYTSSSGATPNSNPIILNAGGRVPSEIWLTDGLVYKFVLYSSTDQLIGSWDNIVGINSNFVNFVTSEEVQIATAGQTVFTLTTMSYQPGINNLVVYVDGVNQVEGGSYSFVETNSTTVTFTSGLHLGAVVKFVSAETVTTIGSNAAAVAYEPAGSGAVTTTVQAKLRETVSVKDFGAVGDGVTNDTDAFAAASAYITSQDGGTLVIPPGTYIVGKQTFAGATGLGYAYQPASIIAISDCTNPVVIEGNGAVLKIADGLRFGAFDPVTGAPFASTPPFYDADYTAGIGQIIAIFGNKSVAVRNLELDGNINNQIIGGEWGDTGRQLGARGIYDVNNDLVLVENVYSHHHGLDGFETQRIVSTSTEPLYPHTYINCRSTYNGRQGMSWTGGNHLTCIDCDFSHTGKNGVVASAPGAGVDIEPEGSIGKNGTFINCRFYDNAGVGMLASTGPSSDCSFYNCQMIGTTNWSGWAQQPAASGYRFHDCKIVGAWVWPGGNTDPELAAKWFGCKFLMDPAESPNGTIYQSYMDFNSSTNVLWEGCVFYSANGYQLPFSDAGVAGAIYSNCTFEQDGAGTFFTRGNFYGHNRITHSGFWDSTGSQIFGRVYENGVEKTIVLPSVFQMPILSNDGGSGKTVRIVSHFSPTTWAGDVGGAIQGDIVLSPSPTASGFIGSVCVASGNPGTWKTFGAISV